MKLQSKNEQRDPAASWSPERWPVREGLGLDIAHPNAYTDSVLAIAQAILRKYGIGYLFAPFTLFATYYFQSILKARTSMGISLSRGLIIGGVMLYVLPALFGPDSLWFAMPTAEISVAAITAILMGRFTRKLDIKPQY